MNPEELQSIGISMDEELAGVLRESIRSEIRADIKASIEGIPIDRRIEALREVTASLPDANEQDGAAKPVRKSLKDRIMEKLKPNAKN